MVDGLVTSINLFDICVVSNRSRLNHDSIALHVVCIVSIALHYHLHCSYIILYILHIILHSFRIVMHIANNIVPVKFVFFAGTILYVRLI